MAELSIGPLQVAGGLVGGAPIVVRAGSVIPRVLMLRVQWKQGGWFWSTPVGFDLQRTSDAGAPGERTVGERHIILDLTRLALIALGMLTAITGTSALRSQLQRRIGRG
jgi:hypothetical protein